MSIVVAKLLRLGKDGDNFDKKLIAQQERTRVLIDNEFIKEFNLNFKVSGRIYEIDQDATEERNSFLLEKETADDPEPALKTKRGRPAKGNIKITL